jgi:hypothetical protein
VLVNNLGFARLWGPSSAKTRSAGSCRERPACRPFPLGATASASAMTFSVVRLLAPAGVDWNASRSRSLALASAASAPSPGAAADSDTRLTRRVAR